MFVSTFSQLQNVNKEVTKHLFQTGFQNSRTEKDSNAQFRKPKLSMIILIVFTKRKTRCPQKGSSFEETRSQFEILFPKNKTSHNRINFQKWKTNNRLIETKLLK